MPELLLNVHELCLCSGSTAFILNRLIKEAGSVDFYGAEEDRLGEVTKFIVVIFKRAIILQKD